MENLLPAIDLGQDGRLEIVVLIQYKTKDQDDGETSRFEIQLRPETKSDPVMRVVIRLCFEPL